MAYVFANDIGGFQGAREREQGRFDALARQAAADQERAIASANEADRFAYQAAARDAQLMEDRNRFQLQQALQERDREERRGDVLFNRRLMLGQEGREQARLNLAERRFKADEDAFNKQLDLDQRVAGEEGRLLMQQFDAAERRKKELADTLAALDARAREVTNQAVRSGLRVGRNGLLENPSGILNPGLDRSAATANQLLQEIASQMQRLDPELKSTEALQKTTRARAAGMQAYFTPEGLATATGSFYPFPASAGPVAPAPAPTTRQPAMRFRLEGGQLVPVQ